MNRMRPLTVLLAILATGRGSIPAQPLSVNPDPGRPAAPGTKLWHFKTDDQIRTPAAIGPDNSIYVTAGRKTYSLAADGRFQWQIDGDDFPPVVGPDGTLFVITGRRFQAINPDGTLRWRFSLDDPLEFECCATVAPDGTIYLTAEGERNRDYPNDQNIGSRRERLGRLYSISAAGQGNWRLDFSILVAFGPILTLDNAPVIGLGTEKLAFYSVKGTHLRNINLSDDPVVTPAIGPDGTLYTADNNKIFYAIDPLGKIKWTFRTGDWILSSPAVGPDGAIYFGSDNRRFYALNPDGSKRWEFLAGDVIRSSPALAADGTIYFGCIDGKVYALDHQGKLLWTFATPNPIFASPTIDSQGTVLIGSNDHVFYAIKGTSPLARSSWPKYRGGPRQTGRPFEAPADSEPLRLRLELIRRPANGTIELMVAGAADYLLQVEASSDLLHWSPLSTPQAPGPLIRVADPAAERSTARFYRVMITPSVPGSSSTSR